MKNLMIIMFAMFVSVSAMSNELPDPTDPQAHRYAYDSTLCKAFRSLLGSKTYSFEEFQNDGPNSMICYATKYSIQLRGAGEGYQVYTFIEEYTREVVMASFIMGRLSSVQYL